MAMIATSCQQEVDLGVGSVGETATVSINVGTPTRAYSDGFTATNLQYAVYDVTGAYLPDLTVTDAPISGSTTVDLKLVTGNTYTVIFWAAAPNAPYTVNFANKTMTVDYAAAKTLCNDEARDAFLGQTTFEVKGAQTEAVELKRPFAQLNIGTSDYVDAEKAGYIPTQSTVTVKNIYNKLNIWDGSVDEEDAQAVTFATADINKAEAFPVDDTKYDYLAMNYLLVSADQETIEVEFACTDGATVKTRTVGSVPVQRNYRTNLYGAILTSNVNVKVEIEPEYDPEDVNLYNVFVDGVSYTDFTAAVAAALEKGKAVEFVQNVAIDADNTITIPAGKTLTLNLNGYTLSGVTDDADKNDDGQITSADNEVMFDVRGTMNVNGGRVTIKHVGDSYADFGWNACGEAFYVAGNGTLNVNNATVENFGGVPMAYAIDLVNASATRSEEAGLHLNVENSYLKSSYIPVRVFNNGAGMNHVTINNSTLEGTSRAFWVHVYSSADNGGRGEKSATLDIDIYNNGNTFIANSEDRLIEYGFTDEINVRPDGTIALKDAEGNVVEGIGKDLEGNYAVTAAAGLDWIDANIAANNGFEGQTVVLANDIDLFKGYMDDGDPISTTPIGRMDGVVYGNAVESFKGTFDGQGHSIKNLYQNGWALNYDWDRYGAVGLFSRVENATIKNLVIDGCEIIVEGGNVSAIAANAAGNCTFENITLKNTQLASYNNGVGGIVAWSEAGVYNFKNIKIEESVVLTGLWGSYDTTLGGVLAEAEPGATYNFENVEISCKIDAFNDVISSYQWYSYRMCGMVVGRCQEYKTVNGVNYPDLSKYNFTFNNVVVNYGDWMNYHYCVIGRKNGWRVEPGYSYSGLPADADHSTHAECCQTVIPFDQLVGGPQSGQHAGYYGLREVDGVTVNYPASYRREVSSAAALTEALGKGVSVILDEDIDFGSTQLAVTGENQVVDLGGHALTTANNWGGISLKNGATIKNGTITHAGNTAAIKAFNGATVENVTINATCATADKTVTGIAVQQGANVESIKNVTINGVSQGIEVGYQATVGLIENAVVNESNNGTAKGIALVINGGKVGKAKDCTFKGETYGITLHLKGVFAAGLELENCKVEGTAASIYAWDEKGISNTSGSLNLTYDAATTLTGPFVWDFEEECQSVVTLNRPQ